MMRTILFVAMFLASTSGAFAQSAGTAPQLEPVGACTFGGSEVAMMHLETNQHGTAATDMNGQRWYFSHGVPCWKKIYPIQRR